ncbi:MULTISPECIES: ABC transporter ATP-binding protein [Vibrio]|uniref:Putative iron-siderophore ABC transporter ATP-binding protein n=1 Tax=Vibrio halioticoli NBRC 102217 TaxID=1219072 RepID=V5FGT4_9VIBR|nr:MULTISPECIES: ABC transporter ATP-binding protein [Vibrio]MPW35313.1 ATP-binding cassette domain-containing protein [Vibrio sp. B1Z05]GAD88267.1 putative iron-siderophore ABC transporter ATP-binding protein [Vibrio halioticoli NBRC 102217]
MGLKISNISVSFAGNTILNDLSIPEIHSGEMVSLIGKNGAGKSTLLKQMTKLIRLNPKSVTLDDKPLVLGDIGYLPQDHRISASITVVELLITTMHVGVSSLFTRAHSAEKALALLEQVGIIHLANKLCTELSGGESQMVGLAQAVINQPKVLILDEPTSALDMSNQLKLLEYVRSYTVDNNACVLMVVHDLNLAIQYSHKVAALHDGQLFIYGEPKKIIDQQLIQDVFNVNSQVIQLEDHPVVVVRH